MMEEGDLIDLVPSAPFVGWERERRTLNASAISLSGGAGDLGYERLSCERNNVWILRIKEVTSGMTDFRS